MLSRVISVYLATALVACPYFCKQGSASPETERVEAHNCCGCAHAHHTSPANAEFPEVPDQPREHSGSSCQCICGGAVEEDAPAIDFGFDAGWTVPALLVPAYVAQTEGESLHRSLTAPPPDEGGMSPGRALRCRLMSFLC
jgi:hypothetical protein